MIAQVCPCKRTSCKRHGNCEACREYHKGRKRPPYCEREGAFRKGDNLSETEENGIGA